MSRTDSTLLIVDDDEDILIAGKLLLRRHFSEIVTTPRPQELPALMQQHRPDVILLDMNFGPGDSSGEEGFAWLQRILEADPEAVVVLITAHFGVDVAVEAIKRGATDFIAKPWQNEKVVATVTAAAKLRRSRRETAALKNTNRELSQLTGQSPHPMLGSSAAMRAVQSLIQRSAPTDANVLILGENGTGKELVARALHRESARASGAFLSVDVGALPESLFESELFGHRKGAFTDARKDRIGRFQAANGGTLFLDEIGNVPLHLQARLLTVLEQRQVTPVGADTPIPIDVRIIAATNVPRSELTREQRFRQDLLFRLNTVEIQLPPLRERRDDIPEILDYYTAYYARKYDKPARRVSADARAAVLANPWPGNVRALRHAIERAVILAQGEELGLQDFQLQPAGPTAAPAGAPDDASGLAAGDLNLARLERRAVEQALKRHGYNISHAAKELGLTRAALYRRMEKYDL